MKSDSKNHFRFKNSKSNATNKKFNILTSAFGYDIKLYQMVRLQSWRLGNVEYPFMTIL